MTIEARVLRAINARSGAIILRSDIASLGSRSQVPAALNSLQRQGLLVRIGVGLYAKTRKSSITGIMLPAGSLESLALEALQRLGVAFSESMAAATDSAGLLGSPRSSRKRCEVLGGPLLRKVVDDDLCDHPRQPDDGGQVCGVAGAKD